MMIHGATDICSGCVGLVFYIILYTCKEFRGGGISPPPVIEPYM